MTPKHHDHKKQLKKVMLFLELLRYIEEDYSWWFESRHGRQNDQEHDTISNYVTIELNDDQQLTLTLVNEDELLPEIINCCIKAHNYVFQ